jgi:DNA-directed RNA polymerase subunit RPC12/RpoP/membrane protein implicated in regulation of membrane protease activity
VRWNCDPQNAEAKMGSKQGWFESDPEYRQRITREANERKIEESTGSAPKQGWLESDQDYAERIAREANECVVKDSTGSAPKQGWLESDDDYRQRIGREANERVVEDSTGSTPKRGWLETEADYDVRVRKEANEESIEQHTGAGPKQGWFEGDHDYRARIAHEAREIEASGHTSGGSKALDKDALTGAMVGVVVAIALLALFFLAPSILVIWPFEGDLGRAILVAFKSVWAWLGSALWWGSVILTIVICKAAKTKAQSPRSADTPAPEEDDNQRPAKRHPKRRGKSAPIASKSRPAQNPDAGKTPPAASPDAARAVLTRLSCSSCQAKLRVKATMAGKNVKCPRCGYRLQIPPLERQ